MICVLYASLGAMLARPAWDRCLLALPRSDRARLGRYRRWQDRQAGLVGKLLLAEGLAGCGHPPEHLRNLVWDAAGRPFLDIGLDFNISHSGSYVVCALTPEGRVGIDIEQIRPIDVTDFEAYMTRGQWEEMMAAENRLETFFKLWTQKEAVAKADGRGIALPLNEIAVEQGQACLAGVTWEVNQLRIADGYCCHLATSRLNQEVRVRRCDCNLSKLS